MNKPLFFFGLYLMLALTACSPHPASGQWRSSAGQNQDMVLIDVQFDGKAQIFDKDNKILRRCFWAAQDNRTIELQCVKPEDKKTDIHYQLTISGKQANLSLNKQQIALFRK